MPLNDSPVSYSRKENCYLISVTPTAWEYATEALSGYPDGTQLNPTYDSETLATYPTVDGRSITLSMDFFRVVENGGAEIRFIPTESNKPLSETEKKELSKITFQTTETTVIHRYTQRPVVLHNGAQLECAFIQFQGKPYALSTAFNSGGFGYVLLGASEEIGDFLAFKFSFPRSLEKQSTTAHEGEIGLRAKFFQGVTTYQALPPNAPPCLSSKAAYVSEHYATDLLEFTCDLRPFGNGSPHSKTQLIRIFYTIFLSLCRELLRLTALQIIHRDIKPDNIFLKFQWPNREDLSTLTTSTETFGDFGISVTSENGFYTGKMSGTKGYSPPEFFTQAENTIGHAADTYSLAVTYRKVLNHLGIVSLLSPNLVFLMSAMTKHKPEDRLHLSYALFILSHELKEHDKTVDLAIKTPQAADFLLSLLHCEKGFELEFTDDFWFRFTVAIENEPKAPSLFETLTTLRKECDAKPDYLRIKALLLLAKTQQKPLDALAVEFKCPIQPPLALDFIGRVITAASQREHAKKIPLYDLFWLELVTHKQHDAEYIERLTTLLRGKKIPLEFLEIYAAYCPLADSQTSELTALLGKYKRTVQTKSGAECIVKLCEGTYFEGQYSRRWIALVEKIEGGPYSNSILSNPNLFIPPSCLEMKLTILYRLFCETELVKNHRLHMQFVDSGKIVNSTDEDGLLTFMTRHMKEMPAANPYNAARLYAAPDATYEKELSARLGECVPPDALKKEAVEAEQLSH